MLEVLLPHVIICNEDLQLPGDFARRKMLLLGRGRIEVTGLPALRELAAAR